MLGSSNFAVHSFYGQYNLWLFGGVRCLESFSTVPKLLILRRIVALFLVEAR